MPEIAPASATRSAPQATALPAGRPTQSSTLLENRRKATADELQLEDRFFK